MKIEDIDFTGMTEKELETVIDKAQAQLDKIAAEVAIIEFLNTLDFLNQCGIDVYAESFDGQVISIDTKSFHRDDNGDVMFF